MQHKRIYLIGFMGSGKTHLGKRLAAAFDFQFLDLDDLIIQRTGKSISELFATIGEEKFRVEEAAALKSTALLDRYVISCGGGTPCFFDNINWINSHGLGIYLRTDPLLLLKRLAPGKAHRPLLSELSNEQLLDFIIDKVGQRSGYYEQAAVIVDQHSNEQDLVGELKKVFLNITGH